MCICLCRYILMYLQPLGLHVMAQSGSLCMCACVCVHTYTHVHLYYIHVYAYAYAYAGIYKCVYSVSMCACMYPHENFTNILYTCRRTKILHTCRVYECMYVCMCVCTHMKILQIYYTHAGKSFTKILYTCRRGHNFRAVWGGNLCMYVCVCAYIYVCVCIHT